MTPTLEEGDHVFVDPRAYLDRPPRTGDVVVARHPFRRSILWIKRVRLVTAEGLLELVGDNSGASTDSRSQGKVPYERVLGRVTSRWTW
jgi:nickel-type superoxide dismutase maturation protease